MRRALLVIFAASLLGSMAPAMAAPRGHFRDGFHGPRSRSHVGVYFGGSYFNPYWSWPYWSYSYPYPYYYPPYAYYPPPYPPADYPGYDGSATPGPAPAQSWYYCDDPSGYYPYVQSCKGPWRAVPVKPQENAPQPPEQGSQSPPSP